MQRTGISIIALIEGHIPQVAEGVGDTLPVPQLPCYRQALLIQRTSGGVVALIPGQSSRSNEGIGTRLGVLLRQRLKEQSLQTLSSFAEMTSCHPKRLQGRSQTQSFLTSLPYL